MLVAGCWWLEGGKWFLRPGSGRPSLSCTYSWFVHDERVSPVYGYVYRLAVYVYGGGKDIAVVSPRTCRFPRWSPGGPRRLTTPRALHTMDHTNPPDRVARAGRLERMRPNAIGGEEE